MGETGAKIRFAVEHVFATQKNKMKLCIRTIGTNKATVNMASPISLTTCSDTSFMSVEASRCLCSLPFDNRQDPFRLDCMKRITQS